jgi:hypothetical protein
MPSFIAWGIRRVKSAFAAVARFFSWLFGVLRRKPRTYTYTVSSDDVRYAVEADKDPRHYVSQIIHDLNNVTSSDRDFMADLGRIDIMVLNSSDIYPAYDLKTLEGRNTLITDTLAKFDLTRDQMMPALTSLSQILPQAVVKVLYGLFPTRHFLATTGGSEFKIDANRISLKYESNVQVTNDLNITQEDIELKNSGQGQLNILTVVTIDLSKLHKVNSKIECDSDAITQTATLTILNDMLDLDFAVIDKQLHKKIEVFNKSVEAVTTIGSKLTKKTVLTLGFSNLDKDSIDPRSKPTNPPAPPKFKTD